ncbi:MAG: FMN-binding negative transcriptional regulator [Candidatus Eremiobacteraeota bacterium]|nr:FMN-binding negative transcriptional regulator [Candidatus Eremiobacteraeota bacterium]
MYRPAHFREDDTARIHAAMREYPFATLVTSGPDGPVANHVPMLFDEAPEPNGSLVFHVARANPVWQHAEGTALAIFLGPHAYVSPNYYPSKRDGGKVVPTWNYLAVHARGPLEVFDDPAQLRALVERLTATHEAPLAEQWRVSDAPDDFVASQLKGIVGLRMRIARLEGKWKMGQNRPEADREGATAALANSKHASDRAAAAAMRAALDRARSRP